MASAQPLAFRWGIISTGFIATAVTKDLLVDPKTRDVHDVVHKIVAVGSRSVESAQKFIDQVIAPLDGDHSAKAYGSYAEVYAHPDVDAIYIGTPHTLHYENARDALKAKKAVLCEKPVTTNAAELRSLLDIAKENGVFFMEALWTRFLPIAKELKTIAEDGTLGDVVSLHADLSGDYDIANIPKTHRILDPQLGGGALLDLGSYPLIWAILFLYENPANNHAKPTSISGSMLKTPLTGVDSSTSFTVAFGTGHLAAHAILSCNITLPPLEPGVYVRFRGGNIKIATPIYCPQKYTVQYFDKPGSGKIVREETRICDFEGRGWHFQADEVARCVSAGKVESDIWPHEKSILQMEIFDEVRRQGGYKLPKGVEKVL